MKEALISALISSLGTKRCKTEHFGLHTIFDVGIGMSENKKK